MVGWLLVCCRVVLPYLLPSRRRRLYRRVCSYALNRARVGVFHSLLSRCRRQVRAVWRCLFCLEGEAVHDAFPSTRLARRRIRRWGWCLRRFDRCRHRCPMARLQCWRRWAWVWDDALNRCFLGPVVRVGLRPSILHYCLVVV